MTVFVLIRADQNEHGFVDASITGVFQDERAAHQREILERQRAREEGLIVEDDGSSDVDWSAPHSTHSAG